MNLFFKGTVLTSSLPNVRKCEPILFEVKVVKTISQVPNTEPRAQNKSDRKPCLAFKVVEVLF